MTPEEEVIAAARAIIDASNTGDVAGAGPQEIISAFAANGGGGLHGPGRFAQTG